MIYTPAIPSSAIMAVIMMMIAMPGLSFATEYAIRKKLSKNNIYLSFVISVFVCVYLFMQMYSTKIVMTEQQIELSSLSFTNSVQLTDVAKAEFYDSGLPAEYEADWRINGIGLYGYLVGKFKTSNGDKIYIQSTEPPYIVLTMNNNNPTIVMSADKNFYTSLQNKLAQPPESSNLANN